MRIYDVSVPISASMPTYPGDPGIEVRQWLSLEKGDVANVTSLHLGAHTGTHVDAPAHFLKDAPKSEFLDLNTLIGDAQLIELPLNAMAIEEAHLENNLASGTSRLLFKTRNSAFWNDAEGPFRTDYTYISPAAAQKLVDQGVKLVGIDYLSVEQFGTKTFETHEILLSNGVAIIEGLDLRQVSAGHYELICLPLKIADGSGDGAPARVVLRTFA